MQSEKALRDALAGILEENFGVQVISVNDYDDQGVVFGRPNQVELDVIIKNGLLLIRELKSSIDKVGMYIFEKQGVVLRRTPPAQGKPTDRDFSDDRRARTKGGGTAGD
jgi:hypothetical protein